MERENPKKRTRMGDVAGKQNKLPLKRMLFAGIQAAGGVALAVYTYKNSASRIWPSVYTVIAFEGTCNVFKNIRKIFWRSVRNKGDESYSLHNVATGTIIYFGSLYAFSEAWRSNRMLWMPFLGIAASGFFYAVYSTYSRKRVSTVKLLSTCCQMAFEPSLIVGGATYLLYFRNHEEGWLFWFLLVATGFSGYKFAIRGICRETSDNDPNIHLLEAIELLMGGCLITASCMVSAVYVSAEEFSWASKYFTFIMSFFGVFFIKGSITCFQHYLDMEEDMTNRFGAMTTGTLLIFLACLMVKCMGYHVMACCVFAILAGGGHFILWTTVYHLYRLVPRPEFIRYCQRALGPLLTLWSSLASAYIGYRFGWRSSMLMTPFVPAGIYVTYKGFSRTDES